MNRERRGGDPEATLRRLGIEEVTQRLEVSPLLVSAGSGDGGTTSGGCCDYHCRIFPGCPRPDNPPPKPQ